MNSNEIATPHRRRLLAGAIAFLTVAGVVVAFASTSGGSEVVETAAPLNRAIVERGDLIVNESLDGVVENVDQLQVVHRVDEASVGSSGTGTAGGAATGSAATGSPTGGVANVAAGTANLVSIEPVSAIFIAEATPSVCAPVTPTTGAAPTDASAPAETAVAADTSTSTSTSIPTTSIPTTSIPTTPTTSADVPPTAPQNEPVTETTAAPVDPTSTTTCDETTATTGAPDATLPDATLPDATAPDTQPAQPGQTGAANRSSTGSGAGSASFSGTGATAGTTTASAAVYERVTSIAVAGDVLVPGDIIYTVDGRPVIAMLGDIPAWRDLSAASDDGIDVLQLETTLAQLGYDNDGEMVIDETYDSDTTAAVQAWQVGLGVDDSGSITLGDIVFLPTNATVSSVTAATGDDVTDGSVILTIDAQRTQIRADVPTELQTLVAAGTTVTIGSDESTIERLVSAEVDGTVTVQAIVTPTTPIETAAGSAVTLRLSETVSGGSLIVPASAITSRLDGTYAVRLIDGEILGDWVTIIPIAIVDGNVAIDSSQLDEGATVAIP